MQFLEKLRQLSPDILNFWGKLEGFYSTLLEVPTMHNHSLNISLYTDLFNFSGKLKIFTEVQINCNYIYLLYIFFLLTLVSSWNLKDDNGCYTPLSVFSEPTCLEDEKMNKD